LLGGQLTELSANAYQLSWNTGEVLTVTNEGDYLDYNVELGPNATPGSTYGLLGPNAGQADDFTMPDGSILPQPLTSDELSAFATARAVPQALSLFNYGPGQTTATFTDPNLPTAPLTLADFPANVLNQAAQAVAAAGITDPTAAAAAEFDYIVTGGQTSALSADANLYSGFSPAAATVTPSGPVPVAVGVIADQRTLDAQIAGATDVTFDLYLTTASSSDTTIDYTVITPYADDFDAAAFGGAFPTGEVTIAAGQTAGQFTIALPQGALGSAANEDLEVQISAPGGTAIVSPDATTTVVAPPAPGPAPAPQLGLLTNVGTLTQSGDDYTLDLGEIGLGEPMPTLEFALHNAAAANADEIGGTFDVADVTGFSVNGANLPSVITGGDSYDGLMVTVNDGNDGTPAKFGANSETITFTPQDVNASGYSASMTPLTLTINYTLVPPTMVYS
jgi:hypothetical protein